MRECDALRAPLLCAALILTFAACAAAAPVQRGDLMFIRGGRNASTTSLVFKSPAGGTRSAPVTLPRRLLNYDAGASDVSPDGRFAFILAKRYVKKQPRTELVVIAVIGRSQPKVLGSFHLKPLTLDGYRCGVEAQRFAPYYDHPFLAVGSSVVQGAYNVAVSAACAGKRCRSFSDRRPRANRINLLTYTFKPRASGTLGSLRLKSSVALATDVCLTEANRINEETTLTGLSLVNGKMPVVALYKSFSASETAAWHYDMFKVVGKKLTRTLDLDGSSHPEICTRLVINGLSSVVVGCEETSVGDPSDTHKYQYTVANLRGPPIKPEFPIGTVAATFKEPTRVVDVAVKNNDVYLLLRSGKAYEPNVFMHQKVVRLALADLHPGGGKAAKQPLFGVPDGIRRVHIV